jgi:predicted nucleic acid-binding protein
MAGEGRPTTSLLGAAWKNVDGRDERGHDTRGASVNLFAVWYKSFVAYRRRGGSKRSPLPDFFIGAHAAVAGYWLMTRDATHYRTYFPKLTLIAPD